MEQPEKYLAEPQELEPYEFRGEYIGIPPSEPRMSLEEALAWCQENVVWMRPSHKRWIVSSSIGACIISGTGNDLVEAVLDCQAELTRIAHVCNAMQGDMERKT